MTGPASGGYPAPGEAVTSTMHQAFLGTLGPWIEDRGQRLVALDERLTVHGSDDDRRDVALAFVVWQGVRERRDELAALRWADPDTPNPAVADLVHRRVADPSGTLLAANLPDAVALVDAFVGRLDAAVLRAEASTASVIASHSAITADLDAAERLAVELGDQVRAVADLRRSLARIAVEGIDTELAATTLERVAAEATRIRADLEALDAERRAALAACADAASELRRLAAREAEAHAAVRDCIDRIAAPPRLAVPSVAAVEVPPSDLASLPWAQARPIATTFVRTVERLGRAFDAVIEAYTAPRRERDDLRGLLQAYRDKADELGAAERSDLDEAYGAARSLLWSAPCDLDAARPAVARYQALVVALHPAPEEVP